MLTKGIILSIDQSSNTCQVRIPIFEGAGNKTIAQAEATFAISPGHFNNYAVDDVVFVEFENNQISCPVVVGKLYLGQAAETAGTLRGAVRCSELTTAKMRLPADATIDLRDTTSVNVSGNSATAPSLTLLDLVLEVQELSRKLTELQNSFGQ